MNDSMPLKNLIAALAGAPTRQLALFALLNLGIIESLANGLLSVTEVIRIFFNEENCQYVREQLHNKVADEIMSHGAQLPDLFRILSNEEAHREFQHELATLRSLCLKLLEEKRLVA